MHSDFTIDDVFSIVDDYKCTNDGVKIHGDGKSVNKVFTVYTWLMLH